MRAAVEAGRDEWMRRRKLVDQPEGVRLNGVWLNLGEWATPTIRTEIYDGRYELHERRVLEATLRREDRYMELGAGAGFMATLACGVVGADQVVAYEATPRLAEVAKGTAAANGFNPTVINAAVLPQAQDTVEFYVHEDFWTSSLDPAQGGSLITVPARTLDEELAVHRPTYLMVDVEGAEVELLVNRLPEHVRAVCVETHAEVVGRDCIQRMITGLIGQGLALDLQMSREAVAFFAR